MSNIVTKTHAAITYNAPQEVTHTHLAQKSGCVIKYISMEVYYKSHDRIAGDQG